MSAVRRMRRGLRWTSPAAATAAAFTVLAVAAWLGPAGTPAAPAFRLPLIAAVALLATFAAHEAGHAVAAIAAGFSLRAIAVGPLALTRTQSHAAPRWRLTLNRRWAWFGGVTRLSPREGASPRRVAVVVAAGPAMSLLQAVCFGACVPGHRPATPTTTFEHFARGMAILGVVVLLSTSLPGHTGRWPTDGSRLLSLWRRRTGRPSPTQH